MESQFDAAMRAADGAIRTTFGVEAVLMTRNAPRVVVGDFHDPFVSGHMPGLSAVLDGSLPTLFITSEAAEGLKERDGVKVSGKLFWVFRIGPDDCGSRHISLKEGTSPADARYQRK